LKVSIVVDKVRNSKEVNFGFNADTGEYVDMLKAGIVDPAKVTRFALQNALLSRIASYYRSLITDLPEKKGFFRMPPMPPNISA